MLCAWSFFPSRSDKRNCKGQWSTPSHLPDGSRSSSTLKQINGNYYVLQRWHSLTTVNDECKVGLHVNHSQVIWHMVYVYSIPAMRNWVTTVYLRCHHFLTLRGTGISYEDTIEVQPSNLAVTFSNSEGKDLQTMRRSVFDWNWHILFSSC